MELIVLHVIIWGSLLCPRLGFLLTPACGRRGTTTAKYSVENVGKTPLVLNPTKPTAHDIHTGRDPARVRIFDTTLRDGEQSPGCTMNCEEKLVVAKQLAKLGVDVIEAGFPVSSRGDFESVSQIAQVVGNGDNVPIICGLARSVKNDIKVCYDAVRHAKFHRLHLFIATSDIHMKHKLKKSKEEVLQTVSDMVAYGATLFSDIEFSAEDALRSDPRFLYQVYSTAIAAGATTINVPDTVGYSTPTEYNQLIKGLRSNVRGIDDVTISVHGHNDLGLAVANYMSAVEAGARQLECTVNGIGERAGNAALEELAMILHVRKAYYNRFFGRPETCQDPLTNINLKDIAASSRLVSSITGMQVQANKAIVGANAFAHESGIHQDGMLKNKRTYEIMDAESIGLSNNNLVLGKHSGRHAFRSRLTELGHNLSDAELNAAFLRFKALADKKKQISSADIESIVTDEIQMVSRKRFRLEHVQVQCGDKQVSTATVTISDQEATSHADVAGDATVRGGSDSIRVMPSTAKVSVTACQTGTGPVDAVYKTIDLLVAQLLAPATVSTEASPSNRAVAAPVQLLEYTVSSVTAGIDALGEVTVRCKDVHSGRTATGRAANTDVIVASAQAYLNAINRLIELQPEPAATQLIVEKNVDYAVQ